MNDLNNYEKVLSSLQTKYFFWKREMMKTKWKYTKKYSDEQYEKWLKNVLYNLRVCDEEVTRLLTQIDAIQPNINSAEYKIITTRRKELVKKTLALGDIITNTINTQIS